MCIAPKIASKTIVKIDQLFIELSNCMPRAVPSRTLVPDASASHGAHIDVWRADSMSHAIADLAIIKVNRVCQYRHN